jgi:hypothetical protein
MKKSPDRAKGATTEVPGEYLMCEGGGGLSISGDWGPLMIMTLMIMTQQGHRSMQHVEASIKEMLKNQHFFTCQDVSYETEHL